MSVCIYLSKCLNFQLSLENGTVKICVYFKIARQIPCLRDNFEGENRKKKKKEGLYFKGESSACALKPRESQSAWGGLNTLGWELCCADKSLSRSAGSAACPRAWAPGTLLLPATVRRSTGGRPKPAASWQGLCFQSPPHTALVGWMQTCSDNFPLWEIPVGSCRLPAGDSRVT